VFGGGDVVQNRIGLTVAAEIISASRYGLPPNGIRAGGDMRRWSSARREYRSPHRGQQYAPVGGDVGGLR